MDFITAVKTCLRKYVVFQGRAPRSEFWFFLLFAYLAQFAAIMVDTVLFTPLGIIALLALLLPQIAVAVRRLHDLDKSGWWYLVFLIPAIGIIALIIWGCSKGTPGPNRFGDDPLAADAEAVPA